MGEEQSRFMRFLHTADWHLGRLLHGVALLEDQAHVLEQVLGVAQQERPDFLLIAGDVYDRAVPSAEAVELLSTTLERLALDLKLPTLVIAGNHDCPQRLGFGTRLLAQSGVRVAGNLTAACCDEPFTLTTANGEQADIFLLPYAEPAVCRARLEDPAVRCHDSAMGALTSRMRRQAAASGEPGRRRVLVGHAYVDGSEATDSERPLSVGGAGTVSAAHFAGFDYVALGHLHRPQRVGEVARYAGSLLKYSFSEARDRKSVTMVEMPAGGGPTHCWDIPLSPRREVSTLTGTFQELCAQAADDPRREHYLSVDLLDDVMVLDAKGRLEEHYPHILHLDRRILRRAAEGGADGATAGSELRRIGPESVFAAFYRDVRGSELTAEQARAFRETMSALPAELHTVLT